jgi:hypothetical protein
MRGKDGALVAQELLVFFSTECRPHAALSGRADEPGGGEGCSYKAKEDKMDTNLLIVIVVLVLLFGGGGYYWRRRGG